MKNYNEMANDVLRRIGEHETEQRNRRKAISRIVTPLCCFCLVALLGFGVWQGGIFGTTLPAISGEQTLSGENSNNNPNPNESTGLNNNQQNQSGQTDASINNKIVVNSIKGISADRMNIALMIDDFVEMSREEMIEYYGVDYIPDVPDDIQPWEDERSGIYRRNGGTGEVYWDANILNYSNEDFTRSVHIEVDKGSYVLQDYLFFKGTEEKSIINNFEVLIGLSENGYYYSEFMYNGVGFCIDAEGVTEDEFVAIIASIIE